MDRRPRQRRSTTAYGAGRDAVGRRDAKRPPDDLVREAAEIVAFPLRDRLAAAIDDVDGSDTSGLVERIGARYREWKNQQLERALGDVVAMAWSRGVYDGVDDGTVLQWIPRREGRCADCDDNALEPTVKGENVPDRAGTTACSSRLPLPPRAVRGARRREAL